MSQNQQHTFAMREAGRPMIRGGEPAARPRSHISKETIHGHVSKSQ
jgi:hypothetical protein